MIIKKTVTFTQDNVDAAVVELAEEIKKGFSITAMQTDSPGISSDFRREITVCLERRPAP